MPGQVWILDDLHSELIQRQIDPEFIRARFTQYLSGDEFSDYWFCHRVGPDPRCYLHHVHFLPTVQADKDEWDRRWKSRGLRKTRTSDRYILFAQHPQHGTALIDLLLDPGSHGLWQQRRTKLAGYETVATDFCTFGPQGSYK